jgi:hypothetical protein
MIRKGVPLPLLKPSKMRLVRDYIQEGYSSFEHIRRKTGMGERELMRILHALTYTTNITTTFIKKKAVYTIEPMSPKAPYTLVHLENIFYAR